MVQIAMSARLVTVVVPSRVRTPWDPSDVDVTRDSY